MSKEYQPITRRRFYVADPDEASRPHWQDSFHDQMIYGIADQELVDKVDWLTYRMVLVEDLRHMEDKIRKNEGSVVEIEFVSAERLRREAKKRSR